jgi:hypothetical protein
MLTDDQLLASILKSTIIMRIIHITFPFRFWDVKSTALHPITLPMPPSTPSPSSTPFPHCACIPCVECEPASCAAHLIGRLLAFMYNPSHLQLLYFSLACLPFLHVELEDSMSPAQQPLGTTLVRHRSGGPLQHFQSS